MCRLYPTLGGYSNGKEQRQGQTFWSLFFTSSWIVTETFGASGGSDIQSLQKFLSQPFSLPFLTNTLPRFQPQSSRRVDIKVRSSYLKFVLVTCVQDSKKIQKKLKSLPKNSEQSTNNPTTKQLRPFTVLFVPSTTNLCYGIPICEIIFVTLYRTFLSFSEY